MSKLDAALEGSMSKLDSGLALFVLLVNIGAFTPSKFQQGVASTDDPAGKIGAVLTALSAPVIALLIYRNRELFLSALRRVTWPLYLVFFAMLSYFWSVNPNTTLRRWAILAVATAFGVYLASIGSDWRDRLLGRAALVTIVESYLIIAFLPSYGVSGSYIGEWRGVFDHKNLLGRQMVFSFFLALYSNAFKSKAVARMVAFLALFLLIMSRSGTGISSFALVLVFAALLGIRSYLARRESEPIFWLVVVPAFLVAALVGFTFRTEFLGLLGKDESLTGRTTIWAVVFEAISRRPLLGWGFDAFYTQAQLRSLYGVVGLPNHSHDGFFDVIIATGFIGFAIFLIGFFIAFRNGWRVYRDSTERSAQWPLLFLAIFVFVNFTESNLLRKGTFMWIPYVALGLWGIRSTYTVAAPQRAKSVPQPLPAQTVST